MITWRKPATEKKIYLTFDDGPTPELTYRLLDELRSYNAKATFFCLGENVDRYPDVFDSLVKEGHGIGNHSQTHLNGWNSQSTEYSLDVSRCQETLAAKLGVGPRYFRPPYGRISVAQWWRLRSQFEIVLWDILSRDYDPKLGGDAVANNVIANATPGSIVLLHDSDLAKDNVSGALPIILKHFSDEGYQFCTLDE